MLLRTEDGQAFDTLKIRNGLSVGTIGWKWVRLETGDEVLLGPANIVSEVQRITLRAAPGDLGILRTGTGP